MPAMKVSVPEGAARERKSEVRAAVFMALLAVSSLFLLQDVFAYMHKVNISCLPTCTR